MSPEQIRRQVLDQRTDMYGLGCVIFELVSGRLPFTGANPNDLLNKHLNTPAPSVLAYNNNITAEFSELIRKMMSKDRAGRPDTMWNFLREYRAMRPFRITPKPPVKSE